MTVRIREERTIRPGVRWQSIFFRNIKVRSDVIVTRNGQQFRIKGVTGRAPTEREINSQVLQRDVGVSAAEFESNRNLVAAIQQGKRIAFIEKQRRRSKSKAAKLPPRRQKRIEVTRRQIKLKPKPTKPRLTLKGRFQVPIARGRKRAPTKSEMRTAKLKAASKRADVRFRRSQDIFRAVPGLRGDNYIQQFSRGLLALPTALTVAAVEQTILSGARLAKIFDKLASKNTRAAEQRSLLISLKRTPSSVGATFDPRTPQGAVNLVGVGLLSAVAARGQRPSPKAILRKTASIARKTNPAAARALLRASRDKTVLARVRNSINNVRNKFKIAKGRRGTTKNLGREIVIKLRRNNEGVRRFEAAKKLLKKESGFTRKTAKKMPGIRRSLRDLNRKISNLKKNNKVLSRRFGKLKLSPLARAKAIRQAKAGRFTPKALPRRRIKGERSVPTRRQTRELKRLRFKESSVEAKKQLVRDILAGRIKLTTKVRPSIRRLVRKELRKRGKTRFSADILISQLEKFNRKIRDQVQSRSISENAKAFDQVKSSRKKIKDAKVRVKKSPFSPKKRMQELSRLNRADNAAKSTQSQIQKQGQKQLLLLKPAKLKALRGKSRSRIKVEVTKLKQKAQLASKINLKSLSKSLQRQGLVIANLFRQVQRVARKGQVQAQKTSARLGLGRVTKSKTKVITKQVPITITGTQLSTAQQQAQAIRKVLAQLAGTIAVLTPTGRRLLIAGRLGGGLRKNFKFIRRKLARKRFVFTPDIYSVIFGIKVKRGQRFKLLKRGRIFTGAERRPIVK